MASMSTLEQRFWAKVSKSDGCWEWTGFVSPLGYGKIKDAGKQLLASRVSYELNVGPIPDGLCVLHECDNRKCVRPEHLFLGTKGDNNRDRHAKRRDALVHFTPDAWEPRGPTLSTSRNRVYAVGAGAPGARLNEELVAWIRLNPDNLTLREMGARLGVNPSCIHHAMIGKTWKHVPVTPCSGRRDAVRHEST